ncbi:hypothetical protein Tco_0643550, partial [Tanacetum coccineum]
PYTIASPISFPNSTPPACCVEESEGSDTSSRGSTSSDSTTPLLPDHPLTHDTPILVPSLRRTARMAERVQPTMSPGCSVRIAEVAAMSDVAFCKRFRSSYESSPSPLSNLPVRKRYRGTSELLLGTDSEEDADEDEGDESSDKGDESHELDDESHELDDKKEEVTPEGQQRATPVMETVMSEPLRLGYEALRRRELALEEDRIHTLSTVPSPISSPTIPLTVPSPVATPTATIPVDEDQFIEAGCVDTRMANISRMGYDDHRLVHDLLVQQAALQRELQEMRGRVNALKQERDSREQ